MANNKPTILYLITQSEFGGAQKYVSDLALSFKDDFNVHVGVGRPATEPWLDNLEKNNISVHRFKHVVRNVNPYHNTVSIFEMKKLIKKIKPDVVHLNSSMIGFTGAVAARLAGVPNVIYTVHGLVLNDKT